MKYLQTQAGRLFGIFMLAFALTACAGVQTVDTFNKKLATAYVTVQVVSDSAAVALKAGKLTPADATNVVTTSRAALAALDVSRGLYGTNPKAGEDKLQATVAVLTALQAYLATQGAK